MSPSLTSKINTINLKRTELCGLLTNYIIGEGSSNSSEQRANYVQDGERQSAYYRESKIRMSAALMVHILYATTRGESSLTYADNGI